MTDHDQRARTDAFAAWVDEPHARRSARARAARRESEAKRLPRAEAALAAARADGYGPDTPCGERGPVIHRLQGQGCYLQEIGDLFGIGRDYAGRLVSEYRKREGIPSRRTIL